ncbi:MAG: NAD(P)-dependent oxidoreductase [Alphaproteobacteria bacterium]|nr:NAD(P)-dependent oxidoreductase [Alphaproteobacteria bacterium]
MVAREAAARYASAMSDTPPLLLGATGFLGRQVAAWVPTAEAPDRLDVDLEDPGEVRALLADSPPRTVFLCAGALPDADPLAMARLNTRLPVLLVELLPAGSTLVLAGSVAEVGGRDVHEETPRRPTTAYGRSKATGAGAALQIGPTRGVRVVAPRFFQLYGPGEAPHRLLPSPGARRADGRAAAAVVGAAAAGLHLGRRRGGRDGGAGRAP